MLLKQLFILQALFLCYFMQCRCRRRQFEVETVCGVNGVTYKNPCFARCNNAQIAYFGACSNRNTICDCPSTNLPVCDLNGNIHLNECVANCLGKEAIPFKWCSNNQAIIQNQQGEIPLVIRDSNSLNQRVNDGSNYNYRDPDYDDVDPSNLYYGVNIIDYYTSRHTNDFSGLRKPYRRNAGEIG